MAEMTARYKPGQEVTGFAGTAVIGGRFVKVTGAKTAQGDYPIAHAGAGQNAFGVAEYDSAPATQPATDQERRVNVIRRGAIARVTSGAAVAVGDRVASDASGRAVTAATTNYVLGIAMTAATAADQVIEVDLSLPGIALP